MSGRGEGPFVSVGQASSILRESRSTKPDTSGRRLSKN